MSKTVRRTSISLHGGWLKSGRHWHDCHDNRISKSNDSRKCIDFISQKAGNIPFYKIKMCVSLRVCACVCIWRNDIKRSRVFSWAKAILNNTYLLYCNFQNSHNNNSGKTAIIGFPQWFHHSPDGTPLGPCFGRCLTAGRTPGSGCCCPGPVRGERWEVRGEGWEKEAGLSRNSLPHSDVSQQPGWNVSALAFGSPTHAPPAPSAPCLPQTDSAITWAPG